MLYRKSPRYLLPALLLIVFPVSVPHAQVKQQSYRRNVPSEAEREDPRVQAIMERALDFFFKGEANLKDGKRAASRRDFDAAVNTVLESGMDVRSHPKLLNFYKQLVENIHRLEVPPPPAQSDPKEAPVIGFVEQKFEPSSRDALAKFEPSKEESEAEPTPAPAPATRAPKPKPRVAESVLLGPAPQQLAGGRVPAVVRYLNEHLNDPYSMRLLRWSKVRKVTLYGEPYWYVTLRMRAKNGFGAYVLKDTGFYIRRNRVVLTDNL